MFFLSIKHTSAALTLNENYDPSGPNVLPLSASSRLALTSDLLRALAVRTDMTMALDTIVPESLSWEHTDEGYVATFQAIELPELVLNRHPPILPLTLSAPFHSTPPLSCPVPPRPDDSVSHTKTALVGTTVSIPVTNGKLNLGTWQGIYLCEFRVDKVERTVVATCIGE